MLSKFDDYPIHQTADPVAFTVSSDRFTYERFWYNGHAKDNSFYFGIALGRYPNLGILDCSFSLVTKRRQYAFHGSRRAPQEPTDLRVGPFSISILEPMGRHRVVIDPNQTGIECDLVFTPTTAATKEGRQQMRNQRHVIMDVTRLDQFGTWKGEIGYAGKRLEVAASQTCGMKDRSWGIRPVGETYSGGAPLPSFEATHFYWLPIHWKNECTITGWFEGSDGAQWHSDQMFLPVYKQFKMIPGVNDPAAKIWKGKVGHKLPMIKGTRQAAGGTVVMSDKGGETQEITLEPTGLVHRMKGLGYNHPKWGHGKWHGELVIEAEKWDCTKVDPLAFENIHIQQVVKATRGNETGYGVLEEFHLGAYKPYGLTDWFDGAPG